MKIVIYIWRDITHPLAGGAEKYITEIAKLWAKQGHEIIFFCGAYPGCKKKETIDGIHYIRMGGKFSMYLYAANPANHIDCDIVIDCNNGIPFFTPLFYNRTKKILLVFHISGSMWYKETNPFVACIGKFLETKVMPMIYRHHAKVITISESSRQQCKDIGLPNAEIVHPGINPGYHPGKKSKEPEIVYIGRLKKYKSVDTLLKAMSYIKPEPRLNIIGDGDDNDRLRELSDSLGLKNVAFWGYVDEETKRKLLRRAWFAVNPSQVEGWSLSNIECAASGCPVIASNVNGNKDSTIHKQLLFEYNNVNELVKKIKILLRYRGTRILFSNDLVDWAKNFSWEKSANKFMEIIKNV